MGLASLAQIAADGLLLGLVYALVAAGLSLIFGLMDIVNFAHGELMMLAMFATWVAWRATGLDPLVLLFLIPILAFLVGVGLYYGLIARALAVPVNRAMVQVFVTFGLGIFLRGAAQFVFGSDFKSITHSWLGDHAWRMGAISLPQAELAAGIVALIAFALLLLVSRTEFGRALEATREDREAVALIGIDRDRIFALGWGLGTAAVGVAGVMLAGFYYISPDVGANFAIIAYVAVSLGGFGSLPGALIAGIIVGEAESFTAAFFDPALKQVGYYAIFLLVLMIRPRGLFGKI